MGNNVLSVGSYPRCLVKKKPLGGCYNEANERLDALQIRLTLYPE